MGALIWGLGFLGVFGGLGFRVSKGLGITCSRKDLPFSETTYRNHNKEA